MTPGIKKFNYKFDFKILKFSEIVLSLILFCSPFFTLGEIHGHQGSLKQLQPSNGNHSLLNRDQIVHDIRNAAKSDEKHPISREHFDVQDKRNEKRNINGHDRYIRSYNNAYHMGKYRNRNSPYHPHEGLHSHESLQRSHADLHRSREDLHHLSQNHDNHYLSQDENLHHRPQNDHHLQNDRHHRRDFHFREEGQNPMTMNINKDSHSSNLMLTRRGNPNFHSDENIDPNHLREPYNYLSNNFANRNHGPESRISSSTQDGENDFEFPDKIVKDGQVFYRHGANHIDNQPPAEDELFDKEQSDGNFKIFKEMSHDNAEPGNDNLSKGFNLLLNHVRQAQENTPSISAAIAGAAIRGNSKGSFSHVIGSAIKGGYFAASAKGYDDKGGSIHSHIQGTGNGAGGGASAIAPGRDGEAFIQVDNSDNGLSIGQSSTHNGEAFVIADVDKDSQYHYEKGDNTSSFNDKYKNDSNSFSFGEAKSKLYYPDVSKNNADPFENKNIPKYHSDLDNNPQRKTFGMGLIDNIMEKVHQPGAQGYNKNTLRNESSITENYAKVSFESSPTISNKQTHSHPKEKGVVGLVTFPFNTIGSPPGPGELLTQAPDIIPKNIEENFEGFSEEFPYYDTNFNEHNNDYHSDKEFKTEGKELNHRNFENFGQNHNWQYTFETPKVPNEVSLFNGNNKTSTEQSYNDANLVYQPYSSVLIDSYNNRHLLPPTLTPVNQNGIITNSNNKFPTNDFSGNDFNGFSNTLSKHEHSESESRKIATNPLVNKDITDYKIRNSQGPIFMKPQVSVEVSSENGFHSINPVSESRKASNYPSISKDTKDYNYSLIGKGTKENNYPFVNKDPKDYTHPSINNGVGDYNYHFVGKDTKNYNYPVVNKDIKENNYSFVSKDTNVNDFNNLMISNRAPDYNTRNSQVPQVSLQASSDNGFDWMNPVNPSESWNIDSYPDVSKDNPEYKIRNLPGPNLQTPQVSTEVPLETNLHSTNLVTQSHNSSISSLTNRNYEADTSKYLNRQQPMTGNDNGLNHEIPNENFPVYNYNPASSLSFQGPHLPMPFEENFDSNTHNIHLNYPLYNQNSPKDSYGQILPNLTQDQQLPTIPNINDIFSQRPRYQSTNNNPKTILNDKLGSSGTSLTTTERAQVITPGAAGHIQHLNASQPGYPNIRVLTINNNDERKEFYQREGTPIGPGEKIPGAPGYKVPPGFRGRVVLGHQLPVNFESKKAVQGYNARINLTPQRPYAGPVFASVSGPEAASKINLNSKINPNFGNGVQITLSSLSRQLSNLRQRSQGKLSDTGRKEIFNEKLSIPRSNYAQINGNIKETKQGSPKVIKISNGQCGYYINECVRPPPFYRNYCARRFINVGCHS